MKIIQSECWSEEFKLSEPYTIAYEKIETTINIFIKLETDNGLVGYGCAAPDFEVTGETEQSVLTVFKEVIEPFLRGADPFTYAFLIEELKRNLKSHPSALAMADMALFDLIAKKAREPVYRILGGYRNSIATSITVGILPVTETLAKVREYLDKGFFTLKIKGGTNPEEDVERVIKVREMAGPDIAIRFDANQGYTLADAVLFINNAKRANIELLEQPTKRENSDLLKQVSKHSALPVMADESIMTLKDVFHLTSNDCTDMINIKLMKVGGISEAIRINSVAKAANVDSMVGCMDECSMGIAAGLHFALSKPNIPYADLDGHFDLINDSYVAMVQCKKGILYPSDAPGFGWNG